MSSKNVYLDHAAATPITRSVVTAMQPYLSDHFYNPSATYQAARQVRADIEQARASIAKSLGVKPVEIIFTAGATEANNLAIQGVMHKFPGSTVLVSAIEHDSVLEPAGQFKHKIIPVNKSGQLDIHKLKQLIDDTTVLVSVMMANNEIGVLPQLSQVTMVLAAVKKQRKENGNTLPLYLHSDAAQALNYLSVFPNKQKIDLLSLNGGKIYGPKQSGLLFVGTGVEIEPLIRGGGHERNLRSGTENVPAIMGLAAAITETTELRNDERRRLQELQAYFYAGLKKHIPSVDITADKADKLPNVVHLSIPGQDNERLMMELDERGIQCAVGSACSASSDEPSHVLTALGFSEEQAQSSLRFSMGRSTSKKDIDATLKALQDVVHG